MAVPGPCGRGFVVGAVQSQVIPDILEVHEMTSPGHSC